MTAATAARPNPSVLASVGGAAGAKVIVMGLSGVLGVLTSRLIVGRFGVDAYAQYGLLATIPALLPFADLGIASVVFNTIAASDSPATDRTVGRTITTAFRVLLVSGAVLAGAGIVISVLGLWPAILGNAVTDGGRTAALVSACVFGLALPATVGQRVLVGLRRTTTQIAAQAVVAPFILLSVVLVTELALPAGDFVAVFSYVANGLVSVACLVLAARALGPLFGRAIRDVPRIAAVPNVRFFDLAWPSLVQMLALPIALGSDRLLLSHLADSREVAEYNLGAQLFGFILQTVYAAGLALWPVYARDRATGSVRSPWKLTAAFLAGALGLALLLAVGSPWIGGFVSAGRIRLDGWVLAGFVAFVATQAINYPLGMYMTDKRGLRFQIMPILVMIVVNLTATCVLVPLIGAGGPIVASAGSVLICQVLPNAWYVRRDVTARRLRAAEELAARSAAPVTAGLDAGGASA